MNKVDVRFGSKADIAASRFDVCFTPEKQTFVIAGLMRPRINRPPHLLTRFEPYAGQGAASDDRRESGEGEGDGPVTKH